MRKHLTLTAFCCLIATPSFAQHKPAVHHQSPPAPQANATAVGTGVGIANSSSQSGAVAISGQGGQGGNSSSSLTVNNPATINSTVSGTTTSNINSRVSGSTTLKSNPSLAMGLTSAGLETCLGSASGGLSLAGFGAVGGSTYVDEGCQARLDSRTLFAYGLRAAAVARLCQRADMWRAMPIECEKYWPPGVPLPAGVAVAVAPAGYGLPVRALMSADSSGGAIRVVDGRDGVEKDCLSYNSSKQKCLHWSGEPPRNRMAAINPSIRIAPAKPKASAKPLAPASAVANSPAVQAIEAATSGQPKKDD